MNSAKVNVMKFNILAGLLKLAAWASIGIIAYATLTRVDFVYALYYKLFPILMGPEIRLYTHLEHIVAFAVLGAVFTFAYPRRLALACVVVVTSAMILEYLQTLTPDRHGTVFDALEKITGGIIGILIAKSVMHAWHTGTNTQRVRPGS
jgi:VanZ family protein